MLVTYLCFIESKKTFLWSFVHVGSTIHLKIIVCLLKQSFLFHWSMTENVLWQKFIFYNIHKIYPLNCTSQGPHINLGHTTIQQTTTLPQRSAWTNSSGRNFDFELNLQSLMKCIWSRQEWKKRRTNFYKTLLVVFSCLCYI